MDRAFRKLGIKTITPLERLSYLGERTMGALTYHSFRFDKQAQWQLAPAYDLMPTTGMGGEHTMSINGETKQPQLKDLKILAEKYNVSALTEMIEQVKAVSQWSNLAKQYEINPRIIDAIHKRYLKGNLK
jgi:serine/threonine-protein kinase HipA